MDFGKWTDIVWIFVTFNFSFIACGRVTLTDESVGILGANVLEILCEYEQSPEDTFQNIVWQKEDSRGRFIPLSTAFLDSTGGNNRLKITFESSKQNLAFTPKLINENKVTFKMTFTSIECEDEKSYRCLAERKSPDNKTLSASAITKLNVQVTPETPSITYNATVMEFDNVAFYCTGQVGRPAGQFIWKTNDGSSSKSQTFSGTLISRIENQCLNTLIERLILPLTRANNSLMVICEVNQVLVNQANPPMTSVGPINVQYPPDVPIVMRSPDLNSTVVGLEMLQLSCITDGNPAPTYVWMFDGEPVGNGSELILQNLQKSNSGNYTCIATNSISKSNASIAITVDDLETSTEGLTSSNLGSSTIVIISVVITTMVWLILTVLVVVGYKKGFCRRKFRKRKLKELMVPVTTIQNANGNTISQKSERDKAPLEMYAAPDDYLAPDELHIPRRKESNISQVSHSYVNTKGLQMKSQMLGNMCDQHGYTLTQATGEIENYYDEIMRKNTARQERKHSYAAQEDGEHDYMQPI